MKAGKDTGMKKTLKDIIGVGILGVFSIHPTAAQDWPHYSRTCLIPEIKKRDGRVGGG